jgi:type I restriction enzyme S subunit
MVTFSISDFSSQGFIDGSNHTNLETGCKLEGDGIVIPDGWANRRISDICDGLIAGVSVNSEDLPISKGEYGILKTSAVTYGQFMPDENKKILNSELAKAKVNPKAGSILISRMNTLQLVGANIYVDRDYPYLFLPDRIWQLRVKDPNNCCSRWLGYLLSSDRIRGVISDQATGTSGSMKNISKASILNLRIKCPPYLEQKKIAEILGTWDTTIGKTERLIAAKRRLKKALMQQLLTGKKRFKEFQGSKWKEFCLGNVASVIMGQSPNSESYNSHQKGLPLIQGNTDIQRRKTAPNTWTTQITKKCMMGDIIMAVRAPVGEIALAVHEACIGRGVCAIRSKSVDSNYLFQFLVLHESKWMKYAQGSTFTAINSSDIRSLQISIPDNIQEQQRIALVLQAYDHEIDRLEQQTKSMNQQKKGLMQKLLTGKIRVRA